MTAPIQSEHTRGWDSSLPPPPGPVAGMRYAGFWIRFVAILIDAIALGLLSSALLPFVGFGPALNLETSRVQFDAASNAMSTLVGLVYFVGFWAWRGQTVGMIPFNLRVVSVNTGEKIDVVRAFLRYVGMIISIIPLFLGLIWAAFDGRKQGWHDKIANTVVVRPT